jgi:alginate O-acetyltransferase complex protein AlgI
VLFNSFGYVLFLLLAVVVHWRLPHRWQNRWLLLLSYGFYAAWDVRFLALLVLSTLVDHRVALRLDVVDDQHRRLRLLRVSLAVNLLILGTFKYLGFFVESATALLDTLGLAPNVPLLNFVLPVGISFYTFQTMSYTIDVYRRQLRPRRSLVDVALFVSFFPQLVAGPIERGGRLLPQLEQPRTRPDRDQIWSASMLFLQGLVKKVVLADALLPLYDSLARPRGDEAFVTLTVGLLAFWMRFWADFSGYTDMARASARLLGVDLRRNFQAPLIARDPSAFWRQWHISLSEWVRDYIYIPLGGSRGSEWRTGINLLVTMGVMGLWHGASWNFGLWGIMMGGGLVVHRWRRRQAPDRLTVAGHVWRAVAHYLWMSVGMLLFATPTIADATRYAVALGRFNPGRPGFDTLATAIVLILLAVLFNVVQERTGSDLPLVAGYGRVLRDGALLGAAVASLVVFSGGVPAQFVYFQF